MKHLVKAPSSALLDRIYKDAKRACRRYRTNGDGAPTYLRRVSREYDRRLDLAGIYVEHAGMPHVNTEEWRSKDRADEMRDLSFLTISRKTA